MADNEEQQGFSSPDEDDVMDVLASLLPAIALSNLETPENNPIEDTTAAENSDTNRNCAEGDDINKTQSNPPIAQSVGIEENTAPDKEQRKDGSSSRKQNSTVSRNTNETVENAKMGVFAGTGVTGPGPAKADAITNQESASAGTMGKDDEPAMDVDFAIPDTSVLCQTDFLMDPALMDIVEEGLSRVIDTTSAEPVRPEPVLEVRPPPPERPPPARATNTDEYLARPGPSWADVSDLDNLMWNRHPHTTAGRHSLCGDVSIASELALQSRRHSHYGSRRDFQRSSRHFPYDASEREHTRTTALRMSRFRRNQTRGYETRSQFPPLANPALYPTHQCPPPEQIKFETIRQLLNPNYTPQNSPRPRSTSQSTSQSPPMVQFPSSPPKMFLTPRDTHRPSSTPSDYFDMPYVSAEPAHQPLDLSPLPRQLPISQAMNTRPAEVSTTVRSTPRTHTVTSTANSLVYFQPTSTVDDSRQDIIRIEMYASCSEHLLTTPTSHRPKTPTDQLPEHLQYQTWPVDNLDYTDYTEEVDTSECDSWFESMQTDSSVSEAATPQPSVPTNQSPPIIIIEPVSPTSPITKESTSSPRSSSS